MRIECRGLRVDNREIKSKQSMRRHAKSQRYEKDRVIDREEHT